MPMMQYATAKTTAGKNRQVWEGRAKMTGPGGLKKRQLTMNKQGKIVSKKKSQQPMNEFFTLMTEARNANKPSFVYNGHVYVRDPDRPMFYMKSIAQRPGGY